MLLDSVWQKCSADDAVAEVAGVVRENIKLRRAFRSASCLHVIAKLPFYSLVVHYETAS